VCAVDGIQLTEAQQRQYAALKQQADEETYGDREALAQERAVLTGKAAPVDALREQCDEMAKAVDTMEGDIAAVSWRCHW
jgi:hypothetical protein